MASINVGSSSLNDDLEFNPFYKLLQGKFKKKFESAQDSNHLVCIPQTKCLRDVVLTSNFVDTHVLAPSNYLKSHYVSTDKKQSKTVEIENNFIFLKSGFEKKKSIRIMCEECGYNKNFQQFRILIIESPLCPVQKKSVKQQPHEKYWSEVQAQSNLFSFSQSKKFLFQHPPHKQILSSLDKQVLQFLQNYMPHPLFLLDAASKLSLLIEHCIQDLLIVHKTAVEADNRINTALTNLVESYVLGSVHNKIFPVICQRFASEDKDFANKLKELGYRNVTADQLGIQELFCCPLPAAVVELASLDALVTPSEKTLCITNTIDLITDTIQHVINESQPIIRLTNGEMPLLTSDDLIPLLATVIIQAKLSHLVSNLFYIKYFHLSPSAADKIGFSLATFESAVEFIKTTDFSHLQPCRTQLKKEISLEELMEVTERLQLQEQVKKRADNDDSPASVNFGRRQHHVKASDQVHDRELQKITKMIEASTQELQQVQKLGLPRSKGHQRSSSLGDYLCGHQEGCGLSGISFGKQN